MAGRGLGDGAGGALSSSSPKLPWALPYPCLAGVTESSSDPHPPPLSQSPTVFFPAQRLGQGQEHLSARHYL